MSQRIFSTQTVHGNGLTSQRLSLDGLQVVDIAGALADCGYGSQLGKLKGLMPRLENRGVQSAPRGIVQDPAGVAVGHVPGETSVGGASKAIYQKFPDLERIPEMDEGNAVMNSSTGAGKRVLHTFSPMLPGSPSSVSDCAAALGMLANAYANALLAARAAADAPGASSDFSVLNLVPVSGGYFAGGFKDAALDHLHPSYTYTALLTAFAEVVVRGGAEPLQTTLNYFPKSVFGVAQTVAGGIDFG